MRRNGFSVAVLMPLLLPAMISCSSAPDPGTYKNDKTFPLFMDRCSACHHYSFVLAKRKNKEEWEATVRRMASMKGCRVTEEEAGEIVRFLAKYRGM